MNRKFDIFRRTRNKRKQRRKKLKKTRKTRTKKKRSKRRRTRKIKKTRKVRNQVIVRKKNKMTNQRLHLANQSRLKIGKIPCWLLFPRSSQKVPEIPRKAMSNCSRDLP